MKKTDQKTKNRKRRQLLIFARDNSLVIHPGCGFEYYITNFFEVGRCPCDDTRPDCPCPESVVEIKEFGWCKCRLYWRDLDVYMKSHIPEE